MSTSRPRWSGRCVCVCVARDVTSFRQRRFFAVWGDSSSKTSYQTLSLLDFVCVHEACPIRVKAGYNRKFIVSNRTFWLVAMLPVAMLPSLMIRFQNYASNRSEHMYSVCFLLHPRTGHLYQHNLLIGRNGQPLTRVIASPSPTPTHLPKILNNTLSAAVQRSGHTLSETNCRLLCKFGVTVLKILCFIDFCVVATRLFRSKVLNA